MKNWKLYTIRLINFISLRRFSEPHTDIHMHSDMYITHTHKINVTETKPLNDVVGWGVAQW